MIFDLMGALAGGLGGLVLLILGIIIFLKDRNSDGPSSTVKTAPVRPESPYNKKKEVAPATLALPKSDKIKIKKAKKGDKKNKDVLKNAQVLLKDVSYDMGRKCVLIDATIVPTTEDGAFQPWYPADMSFMGFVSEPAANAGHGGEKLSAMEWKRWMQSEFKAVDMDQLRGSCRLQFAIPLPQPGDIRFLRFHYQDECFGKAIPLPAGVGTSAGATAPETHGIAMAEEPVSIQEDSGEEIIDETSVGVADQGEEISSEPLTDEEGNPLIFVLRNGVQSGPYSISDIWVEVAEGRIFLTDYAWHEGLEEWAPLSSLIENR